VWFGQHTRSEKKQHKKKHIQTMPTLGEILGYERLDRYLSNFVEVGITAPGDLIHLTLEDYHTLGIDDINDRKKLFQLIQRMKSGEPMGKSAASSQPRQGSFKGAQPSLLPTSKAPAATSAIADKKSSLPRPLSTKLPRPTTVAQPTSAVAMAPPLVSPKVLSLCTSLSLLFF
jgi:hypothetical protein